MFPLPGLGGFAAAQCGKPMAFRRLHFFLPEAMPRDIQRHSLLKNYLSLNGKPESSTPAELPRRGPRAYRTVER